MTKKHEQYREKLIRTFHAAHDVRAMGFIQENGDVHHNQAMECRKDGAEAIAAQVIRDVLSCFQADLGKDSLTTIKHKVAVFDMIRRFAAERGIDLEEAK